VRHESVPGFAGSNLEKNLAVFIASAALLDARNCDLQRQARPSGIGHYKVAASAQNEDRQIVGAGENYCLLHLADTLSFDKIARRASNLEGREWRERNVFQQQHE
jgi:hypothetical protein